VWATVAYAAAAWRHDISRPRERVGEIDNHGDWAASDATRLLDAELVTAEQGRAVYGHSVKSFFEFNTMFYPLAPTAEYEATDGPSRIRYRTPHKWLSQSDTI
jgi:hypothetical protein